MNREDLNAKYVPRTALVVSDSISVSTRNECTEGEQQRCAT